MKSRVIRNIVKAICCALVVISISQGSAQDQGSQPDQGTPASALTTKSVQAVGYGVGSGSTKVNMIGTDIASGATGTAKVEIKSKADRASVQINVKGLSPASTLGAEFLTYVLWVVTPEGHTGNIGELLLDKKGNGSLNATTPAQAFSLIVTAEPYFAVRTPSELVVLQSEPGKNTEGKIFPVSEYKLMKRAQYQKLGNPLGMTPDPKIPLSVYEARNAVEIAKDRLADKYAPGAFAKAQASLQAMESAQQSKADANTIVADARQTAQFAEDARALSIERQDAERIAMEKQAAADQARQQAEAQAAAAAAKAKQQADAAAAAAKLQADQAAAAAKLQADQAQAKADAEIAAQQAARKQAEDQRLAAEREKQQLRARLLEQFNRVLPTTDTDRGLVVNMGDVLFATGKAELNPQAQLALAKLTGIVLNYPSLRLAIGGYTDSTGTADFNQTLSQNRANAVSAFLVSQGLDPSTLTAQGYGPANPVADNTTSQGRQKNRRVEIVISGAVIGTQIGGASAPTQ